MQALVGIETKPDFAVPDVAEGDRYPQLAPAGFGTGCINHPRTQDTQLKLADAAFHAQQQAIIWSTGIIDAVEINDAGFDEPTQFEQMMPIAAVSGEPRCIEA